MTIKTSVLLFTVSAVASTVWSAHPFHSLIRSTWTTLVLAGALVIPTTWRKHTSSVCSVMLTLLAGSVVWQWWWFGGRASGFMPHPNDVAIAPMLMTAHTTPLALVPTLLSASRNALVGFIVMVFMLLPRYRVAIATSGVAALAFATYWHPAAFTTIQSRFGHWLVALRMFGEAPLLGKGPHTFVDYYLRYTETPLAFGIKPEVSFIPWAHSIYLEQLAERGIVGLVAFLAPLWFVWKYGTHHTRACLVAFLAMGVFDLTLLKPWVVGVYWSMVWLTLPS